MSLFETLSDMSKQHAENNELCYGDSGSYKFQNPVQLPEAVQARCPQCDGSGEEIPNINCRKCDGSGVIGAAPTLSLYNLLDHSPTQLRFLLECVLKREQELEPIKLAMGESYTTACSWMNIIKGALHEKEQRDSEAWAEKTAKEIKETLS